MGGQVADQNEQTGGFFFINGLSGVGRRTRKARAHTARINRERKALEPRPRRENGKDHERAGDAAQTGVIVDNVDQAKLALYRPVSPVFGALQVTTFDKAHEKAAAETWRYTRDYIHQSLSPTAVAARFQAFCQRVPFYHAASYSAAIHHDVATKKLAKTQTQATIAHKIECIRLVNQLVSTLNDDPENLDLLLFLLTCLLNEEPTQAMLEREDRVHLFSPHQPAVGGVNIFGQCKTEQLHCDAVVLLVQRAGGLDGLRWPDLARVLASVKLQPPPLPRAWEVEAVTEPVTLSGGRTLATGFAKIATALPTQAAPAFFNLAWVDHTVDGARVVRPTDAQSAQHSRMLMDAHHRVMSLPPREDLSEQQAKGRNLALYECCRLAVMIYSCAVILPLPTVTGWHVVMLNRLRRALDISSLTTQAEDTNPVLIWCLVVANMTAMRCESKQYFRLALRDRLFGNGLTSWPKVRTIVRQFFWSEAACAQGALVMWQGLYMDEAPSYFDDYQRFREELILAGKEGNKCKIECDELRL
ncbi:hypothetical protein LTR10_008081 [Elasticomyces elasticus]|nr:hypothetical protein LTR10_008081 [Elasticomyces elasticus]KAK4971079.1 hypothetical protein LTR42_008058 [Elasticomyces elasticus]